LLFYRRSGISNIYFPLPEMLSLEVFTLVIFVACILSSSHIALKGLQKREWIDRVLVLLKINKSGGEFFLNIRPDIFEKKLLHIFACIFFCFLFTM